LTITGWRKSSRSESGSCVEAGDGVDLVSGQPVVGVRDSQDRSGPVLVFGAQEWRRFTSRLKHDRKVRG
jgi:Domain of unknown function (DUF397)